MNANTDSTTAAQSSTTPSESTKAPPFAMEALRPRWCIQRNGNTIVPLIAMDELPELVLLKGVPVTLTLLEALKGRMELIPGEHPAHGVRYQLDEPIITQTVSNEEGDYSGSDSSPASEGSESSNQKGSSAPDKQGNKGAAGNLSAGSKAKNKALKAPTLTTNDTSIIDTMAKKGTMGKKVFCTYWIQTGNCNYMQEGCRYKHEIPADEETRRAIGFREPPVWPRDELPIQPKPAPALHKPWRRQDGKHERPGAQGPPNRPVAPPATAHGTPTIVVRGNGRTSAGVSTPGPAANTQYNPNATAFPAPHQHFPVHANHMAHQRLFVKSSSGNLSPRSFRSASLEVNGGRSGGSSPPKQPPISRPTKLGQSLNGPQHNNPGASTQQVAPDYLITNRASGSSGASVPVSSGKQTQNNTVQGYSGMPNNWNPQANAPTSMNVSFMAPSNSTRSDSQAAYTPTHTLSTSATPTLNNGSAFGGLNGHTASDARLGSLAHYNGNAFANNGNVSVKGKGPVQYGRVSPPASIGSAPNRFQAFVAADDSDAVSITSPPVQHRVFFREPGQPAFVTNPPEPQCGHNGKVVHALRKQAKIRQATNGGKSASAKAKMSDNGYEVLIDVDEQ